MVNFQHIEASNLKDAIVLLQQPGSEVLAGGTDLLGELKREIRSPACLVSIKNLNRLRQIRSRRDGGITIGALTSVSEILEHPAVRERFPALSKAASVIGTPQLRNMGTVGGNLCQHPRCWYFRNPLFPCWLKGGTKCFAAVGENRYHAILWKHICHAVHPSDLAPVLICLNARVKIAGPKGEMVLPLEELYVEPSPNHRQMTILRPGELITEIALPPSKKGSRSIYLKAMERKAWAFALASVAVHMRMDGESIAEGRLVLGGIGLSPLRANEAEKILLGQRFSEELIRRAAEAAVEGSRPLRDNKYKVRLATELVRHALSSIAGGRPVEG
jgi:xanthine dehydrogenase YagS FAD-binding subunit